MVRPKKFLGQHFLTDNNIAKRITGLLEGSDLDAVIEIGPGKGVLTKYLFERKDLKFFAIDIDKESIDYLLDNYPGREDQFIYGDFLEIDLEQFGEKLAIIGNFPYNISSQIFFRILENRERIEEIVCMIQKEVAERLVTGPGSKRYGILSVLLQAWYNISGEFTVNPGSFFPPPEVKSSVIRLVRNARKELGCNEKLFTRVVKTAFNQRRKVMSNSLSGMIGNISKMEPVLRKRPEQLSVDEFIDLTNLIDQHS